MHYLFIYCSSGILGGIETLIVRMSRWLIRNGNHVTLIANKVDDWQNLIPDAVRVCALGQRYSRLNYYFHAGQLAKELGIPAPDVIKSFDIESSWIACQLASFYGNRCKLIAGNYNPLVFRDFVSSDWPFWEGEALFVRNFLECIPSNARVCCSHDQLDELQELYHQSALLWPIPMDPNEFLPATRRPKPGKIVSVGRLSPMKEYNFYMIDVVGTLIERGHDVTWTVYGKGEFAKPMRERIRERKLEAKITMEGEVPYSRFWQVLEDAWVFVGMGTSIFEAALFKVPNVTASPYDTQGMTWGPLHRFPRGSLGPANFAAPELKVVDELERILGLSPAEYHAESNAVYRHVQDHEIDASMRRFLDVVRDADPISINRWRFLANYPFWLLRHTWKTPQHLPQRLENPLVQRAQK